LFSCCVLSKPAKVKGDRAGDAAILLAAIILKAGDILAIVDRTSVPQ